MSFLAVQYLISTTPTLICNIAGPWNLTLSVTTGGTVFLGNSTGVNATNGAHAISGAPFTTFSYATSAPSPLYAVASSGTVPIGVLLSTPH